MQYREGKPYSLRFSRQSKSFSEYFKGDLDDGNGIIIIEEFDMRQLKFFQSICLSFENGALNGDYKRYYPNGQLYCEGKYEDNYLSGEFTFYTSEGVIFRKIKYAKKDSVPYDEEEGLNT